jgi:glutathione S-transferase
MAEFTIYVGNKAYSSWSLRGWLALKLAGVAFDEVVFPMDGPGKVTKAIHDASPSGRVPLLKHGELFIWDSLAIGEYVNELFPAAHLWPEDRTARALARSASAEMHSGFGALRSALPMNVRRPAIELAVNDEVKSEIARIKSLWSECRKKHGAGGPFLFGRATFADAMFAPVATRFRTYGVPLEAESRAYVDAVHDWAPVREWIDAGRRETWRIEPYERVGT